MTNPENREHSGFNQTVTVQVGAKRRSFQAYVPLPLPPQGLDISPLAYREFDDNFLALAALAAASPDRGYAASNLARASEAAASCNIENISVTPYDILKAQTVSDQPTRGTSQGTNCLRAINQLCHSALSIESISDAHHTLTIDDPEYPTANIGTYRTSQVFITSKGRILHCMAPQHRVQQLMNQLQEWMHSPEYRDASLFARIALTHHQFESIHPYDDGNGRIGRAINCAIANAATPTNFSVPFSHSVHIHANRNDYYIGLSAVRAHRNWEPYFNSMYMAMTNNLLTNHHILSAINDLRRTWHSQLPNSTSLRATADLLLSNPFINTKRASEAFNFPLSRTQELLHQLEAAQIIEPVEQPERPTSWQAPQVMSIAHIGVPTTARF